MLESPVEVEQRRQREQAALAHEQRVKAERARAQQDAEQASVRETALHRAESEIQLLIVQVQDFGHAIWTDGIDILIDPPLSRHDPAQNKLRGKLVEHKLQLLPLLPSERQGPQRI
jgi:hypothetical protein